MTTGTQLVRSTSRINERQFVIFEDLPDAAQRLKRELEKWQLRAWICKDLDELHRLTNEIMNEAVYAIDIDMGEGRRTEGIAAIQYLKQTARDRQKDFYIAALTTHVEFELQASQAGVDAFIVKTSSETDALELLTRLRQDEIETLREEADKPQTALALREYKELERQLKSAKKTSRVKSALDTIQRALNWPFLLTNEQIVLAALDEQLRALDAQKKPSKKVLDLCLDGVKLLLNDRARKTPIDEWLNRANEGSPDFMLRWIDEEVFDEGTD